MLISQLSKKFARHPQLFWPRVNPVIEYKLTSVFSSHQAAQSVGPGFQRELPNFEEERDEILNVSFVSSRAKKALERYHELKERSLQGGGSRGIDRHVKINKKVLIRDRIKSMLDPESSFLEIGDMAGFDMDYGDVPTAGVVAGIGKIHGVFCFVSGNDATVKAGSYYPITVTKSYRCQEIAEELRLPTVYMPDSGGAFLPLQSEIFPDKKHGGRAFYNQAIMSSKGIHQIALVCGSCTAGGAYNPTMCDDAIIVDRIGKIFLAGPPLVKAATGEVVTDEELGGAFLHSSVSGCTDYFAYDEEEAFTICRDIVHSLNMNISDRDLPFQSPIPKLPWTDIAESKDHFSKVDLYLILSGILDGNKFHEFKAFYGPQAITGVGTIESRRIGVVANVEDVGIQEALKITHFVNSCNRRKIPILFLQNSPMNLETQLTENNKDIGVLKCRAALSSQIATANVPKIALTISGLSQDGCLTMCGPSFDPVFHFVWPQALMSSLDMTACSDSGQMFDAFYAAANVLIDKIIQPSETRTMLSQALRIFEQRSINPQPEVETGVLRM